MSKCAYCLPKKTLTNEMTCGTLPVIGLNAVHTRNEDSLKLTRQQLFGLHQSKFMQITPGG